MKKIRPLPRLITAVLLGILILLSVVYTFVMPIRRIPEPSGPFEVGTLVYDLTDPERLEKYDLQGGSLRKFRVQLWYPGEPGQAQGKKASWMPDGLPQIQAIVKTHGFPSFIWNHTVFIKSHSRFGSPVKQGKPLPVILISHGWQGYRNLHTDMAEELASRGYLVAAADHTYGAAAVVFEDGLTITSEPRILPGRENSDQFLYHAAALVTAFAEDNRFILDHLTRVNLGRSFQGPQELSRFEGIIDLDKIGVAGHSTGGGAMVQLALEDPRIDAVLGLDAWVEPLGTDRLTNRPSEKRTVPMLFLRSETWEGGINDQFLVPFVASLEESGSLYQIEKTTHEQFTMLYMYAPAVKWLGMLGSTNPRAFARFQNNTAAAFFDHSLNEEPMVMENYPGLQKREY